MTIIRKYRPLVVVTFDPNGYNLHPDHIAISRFATDALSAATDPRFEPRSGAPFSVPRLLWTTPIAPWEPGPQPPRALQPGVDFIVPVREFAPLKKAALKAHRTQWGSIRRYFFDPPAQDRLFDAELFRQAWGPPLRQCPSSDLLEGLGWGEV